MIIKITKQKTVTKKPEKTLQHWAKTGSIKSQTTFVLKYGSEEKGSSLCKCSILLGFFMSKKQERLRSELLSEDKITNLLGFLT